MLHQRGLCAPAVASAPALVGSYVNQVILAIGTIECEGLEFTGIIIRIISNVTLQQYDWFCRLVAFTNEVNFCLTSSYVSWKRSAFKGDIG